MPEAQDSNHMSPQLWRIAEVAKERPDEVFTSLNHFLDQELLADALEAIRKDSTPGVDGQTWHAYQKDAGSNLRSLLERAKSGTYHAPPVRRAYIPKGDNPQERREIGIPTLEDKVLQRAVGWILQTVYEADFHDCSYGFRPGRSAHQALESLRNQGMDQRVRWVLDVDIRKFFDTLDRQWIRTFLRRRIADGVLLRLIDKWLAAGVQEEGAITYPDSGTPQGGVISPLLANVYLHYVLDTWFHDDVVPRLRGQAYLIRYADDFVIGFTDEEDAHRVLEVLPKRFAKYGLTIHPTKTRLVRFVPGATSRDPEGPPTSFDFLGFTHYWGRSLRGYWVIMRRTASSRFTRAKRALWRWCRNHRHDPISEQHKALCLKIRGHYAYYGIYGNSQKLGAFLTVAERCWFRWLRRRHRERPNWEWFRERILKRYPLPPARIVHPYCKRMLD